MRATVIAACCMAMLFTSFPTIGVAQKSAPAKPRNPERYPILQTLKTGTRPAIAFSFSPDGKVLAVADGLQVHFWDPRTGEPATAPWKGVLGIDKLVFVNAKTIALVDSPETAVILREYPSGKMLGSCDLGKNQYVGVLAGAEGMIAVASSGSHKYVHLLTAPNWREAWKADLTDQDRIRTMAISPDRSEVAVGGWGSEIRVYATKDGKLLRRAGREQYVLPSLAGISYSPDGRHIAFGPSAENPANTLRTDSVGVAIFDAPFTRPRTFRWEPGRGGTRVVGCQFTPDGKTLIVPTGDSEVRLYEFATGKLRWVGSVPGSLFRFTLSPNGRLFAVAGSETDVSVVDWLNPKLGDGAVENAPPPKPGQKSAWDLPSPWAELASTDSEKGYRTVVTLIANPKFAVGIIGGNLKPVPAPDLAAVKSWIGDLGSEDFAQRETAEKELAKLGDTIEPQLREAAKSEVPERRERAIRLLTACTRSHDPDRLRILRAVEVLEYINTPESRAVLKTLASGASGVLLTRDAKAALERLQAFAPKP